MSKGTAPHFLDTFLVLMMLMKLMMLMMMVVVAADLCDGNHLPEFTLVA